MPVWRRLKRSGTGQPPGGEGKKPGKKGDVPIKRIKSGKSGLERRDAEKAAARAVGRRERRYIEEPSKPMPPPKKPYTVKEMGFSYSKAQKFYEKFVELGGFQVMQKKGFGVRLRTLRDIVGVFEVEGLKPNSLLNHLEEAISNADFLERTHKTLQKIRAIKEAKRRY